jgi:hypothetical protein
MKKRIYINMLWVFILSSFAIDANAWGLYTHIYFTQWLIYAAPFLDPNIQKIIKKFPTLVMAGACLPDLAIISQKFNTTHQWQKAEWMLKNARTEQEFAIAIGYTGHLYVDVMAHNHFVPAYEAKWARIPWLNTTVITHISAEWAMDAHIAQHVEHTPQQLIGLHVDILSKFIASCFQVSPTITRSKLRQLAWADFALRRSQLAKLALKLICLKDATFIKTLDYYRDKTKHALSQFDQSLLGNRPQFEPELKHLTAIEMADWRKQCLHELTSRLTTPVDFYNKSKIEQNAIT